MAQQNEPRHAGGAAGLWNVDLRAANDTRDSIETPSDKQAAIRALRAEFEIEASRVTAIRSLRAMSVKATHAADNLALGDDLAADRDIEICREYAREALSARKKMQAAIDSACAAVRAEAVQ